jgi:hypothetical protein
MTYITEFSLTIIRMSYAIYPQHGPDLRVSVIHCFNGLLASAPAPPVLTLMMLFSRYGQGAPRQVARKIDAKHLSRIHELRKVFSVTYQKICTAQIFAQFLQQEFVSRHEHGQSHWGKKA